MASRNMVWTGNAGDGNYDNPANWFDTTNNHNPAQSPPTSSDFVSFSASAGGTVDFEGGSAETFNVNGTGTWTFTGSLTLSGQPGPVYPPYGFTIGANVTFSDVTFNSSLGNGDIDGPGSQAMLTVEGGSTVTSLGLSLGIDSSQSGTLVLTGATTTWHVISDPSLDQNGYTTGFLNIGGSGVGAMTVTAGATMTDDNGATIASNTGSTGTVTVSDDGQWNVGPSLSVGYEGDGTLTIESGGTVDSTGPYDQLGGNTGGVGSVTVDGAGSLWKSGGQISLGINGAGTLIVSNGGSVVAADQINVAGNLGSTGTLLIESGGKVKSGGTYDNIGGNASNAEGLVTVAGPNSSWVLTADLTVGNNGPGTLDISNDGSVQAAQLTVAQGFDTGGTIAITTGGTLITAGPNDNLANSYESVATVTVDGSGSQWKSAGHITVGSTGTGTLTISNAGSVDAADGLAIGGGPGSVGDVVDESGGKLTSEGSFSSVGGYSSGSQGTATVEGVGSSWIVGIGFTVGQSGAGTLDILNDGSVQAPQLTVGQFGGSQGTISITTGGTLTTAGPYDAIGQNGGAFGTVTVDGTGSLWSSGGNIGIGQNGSGTLIVSDNGVVDATDQINIGEDTGGSGDLLIESGGKVSSGGAANTADSIGGFDQNATGTVTVEGSGSSWTLGAVGLVVGNGGDGTLNINNDGSVQAGQLIVAQSAASFGTVAITTGGTLTTAGPNDSIGSNGGSVGSVSVTGTGSLWQSAGDITIGRSGGGALTVGSGGTVTADGLIDVGQNTGSIGSLTINAGGTVEETEAAQSSNEAMVIGDAGTGSVTVTGADALLDLNGNPMRIGNVATGNGALTVSDGGTVTVGSTNSNTGDSALSMGRNGGTGAVTVTGAGSTLNAAGFVAAGRAGTASILVENDGTFTIGVDPMDFGGLALGAGSSTGLNGIGGSGVATVTSGGVLSLTQGINVGGNGVNGALNVNDGGTVDIGTALQVGIASLISGTTYGGNGVVAIGAGGTVQITGAAQDTSAVVNIGVAHSGANAFASTGEITVSGAGALLNTNGSEIAVGSGGVGSLVISQGGSVAAGTPNSTVSQALAVGSLGVGSVTVTGSGSTFTSNGFAFFGTAGTGNLLVENSATFQVINGHYLSIGGADLGSAATTSSLSIDGSGSALVTASGYVDAGEVWVGSSGVTGTLTVNNSGTVEAASAILIGNTATLLAGGTVTTISGTKTVDATTLYGGTGTINVGAGGTLKADGTETNGNSTILVGYGAGGTGTLNVSGAGALADAGGQRITIGLAGVGTMLVSQGGTAEAGANYTDTETAVNIGTDAGATGALTVTDAGSTFTAAGQIDVGIAGTGSVLVENDGKVTATALDSAVDAGSAGVITDTGAGSALNVTGQFTIGDTGSAELSILNGATATVGDMDIGLNTGSTGNVDLEGDKTLLHVTGDLHVGDTGSAVLTIGAGTTLTVDGDLFTGTLGRIVGLGGVIDPKHYYNTTTTTGPLTVVASVAIVNTGTFIAENGLLELNGPVTDTGVLQIQDGGVLQLDKSVVATQTVSFSTASGTLDIKDPTEFAPTIGGYVTGDTVQVYGISGQPAPTYSNANGNTILTYDNGVSLIFAGTYAEGAIDVQASTTPPPCFLIGTRIATERGEITVQELRIGDRVLTADGGSRPVRWIGVRSVDTTRHPKPRSVLPVRVAPDAFGPGAPHSVLFLSPDHAVFIEDVLIPVQYLIDDAAIYQLSPCGEVVYYHVELDRHDVLLAEGLPVESYLDTGNRMMFENGGRPMALHPDFAMRIWDAEGCAPLVVTGPALEAARSRLAVAQAMAA